MLLKIERAHTYKMANISETAKTAMNLTFCEERRSHYELLNNTKRTIIIVVYVVAGIVGVLVNTFVIYAIKKTRQLHIQSIQLVTFASSFDIANSLINILHVVVLLTIQRLPCIIIEVFQFFVLIALYSSSFLTSLISLDRYMHVRYLNEYSSAYNKCRFRLSLIAFLIVIFWQSTVAISVNATQGSRKAVPYTLPVNIIIFISVITVYGQTIRILKTHKRENRSLSSTKRNIVKLSTVYMYLYLVIQGYLLIHQLLVAQIDRYFGVEQKNFQSVFYGAIPSISGVVNGFAFLTINRQSRSLLRQTFAFSFGMSRRNNQIDPPRIPNQ